MRMMVLSVSLVLAASVPASAKNQTGPSQGSSPPSKQMSMSQRACQMRCGPKGSAPKWSLCIQRCLHQL
jgi:hypothetical protein